MRLEVKMDKLVEQTADVINRAEYKIDIGNLYSKCSELAEKKADRSWADARGADALKQIFTMATKHAPDVAAQTMVIAARVLRQLSLNVPPRKHKLPRWNGMI